MPSSERYAKAPVGVGRWKNEDSTNSCLKKGKGSADKTHKGPSGGHFGVNEPL